MASSDHMTALAGAARKARYLSQDEERDLAQRWRTQNDEAALHALTGAHMRLVIALSSRFRKYGLPFSDLVQEGHIGLMEAAARFDPERDVRFSTYATWWIRASLQDFVLRNRSIVRGGTSSRQKALFFRLRGMRGHMARHAGRHSDQQQISARLAEAFNVGVDDIEAMEARLSGHDISLNAPVASSDTETGLQRQDLLACKASLPDEDAEAAIDTHRRNRWLAEAMASLNERECTIVRERRLREPGATLEALGETLGISKERVRQIENKALQKLKAQLDHHRAADKSVPPRPASN